jgi:hypothetical protein
VQTTISLPDAVRKITAGSYEGSNKWLTISPNQDVLNYAATHRRHDQRGPVQPGVFGDAGHRRTWRPQGRRRWTAW